jgi:hypothetical protein
MFMPLAERFLFRYIQYDFGGGERYDEGSRWVDTIIDGQGRAQ